jgi:glycosyltransferase involved in cell wall biosynthesis
MKILHLSHSDRHGGACIAAYRQHQALRAEGVDSAMWVRQTVTQDPAVQVFRPSLRLGPRSRRLWSRRALRNEARRVVRGGVFIDDRSEHGGDELTGLPPADVINVQSFWKFIDLPSLLERLPSEVPVVFTMHEMAPFTGGCDYARDCTRFHEGCGCCPLMGGRDENDLSHRSWLRKQAVFRAHRRGGLHFVADSHWLADQARQSGLLEGLPISVIHYGLDTNVYRPLDRSTVRDQLQIPAHRPVVCFAAANVTDSRKGMRQLVEALQQSRQDPFLLTWGQNYPEGLSSIDHLHLGAIGNEHLMALAYNAGDVFVMPSLQEAFGQTALESIACGVPVVAFEAGGIPDTVKHEETGLLVPVGDSRALAGSIDRLLGDRDLAVRLGAQGREHAVQNFSMQVNARAYTELYRSLSAGSGS